MKYKVTRQDFIDMEYRSKGNGRKPGIIYSSEEEPESESSTTSSSTPSPTTSYTGSVGLSDISFATDETSWSSTSTDPNQDDNLPVWDFTPALEIGDVLQLDTNEQLFELRPHQQKVMQFIKNHRSAPNKQPGLLLKHSTGSGKTPLTVHIIHHYQRLYPQQQVIICCPSGTINTWNRELQQYKMVWDPANHGREFLIDQIMIVTPESLVNPDFGVYVDQLEIARIRLVNPGANLVDAQDCLLIIDEAQHFKMPPAGPANYTTNRGMQIAKCSRFVLLLSATPVLNWPREAASLYFMLHHYCPYEPDVFFIRQNKPERYLGLENNWVPEIDQAGAFSKTAAQRILDDLQSEATGTRHRYTLWPVTPNEERTNRQLETWNLISGIDHQKAASTLNKQLYQLGDFFDDVQHPVGIQLVKDCWRCLLSEYSSVDGMPDSNYQAEYNEHVYDQLVSIVPMTQPEDEIYGQRSETLRLENRTKDAYLNKARAFCNTKSKLTTMLNDIVELQRNNSTARVVVYASRIEDGLDPFEEMLQTHFPDAWVPRNRNGINRAQFDSDVSIFRITGNETSNQNRVLRMINGYNTCPKFAIMLISDASSVGIDLKKTAMVQVMQPEWNNPKLQQAIGRGIRFGAYTGNDPQPWYVDVRVYIAVRYRPGSRSYSGYSGDSGDSGYSGYSGDSGYSGSVILLSQTGGFDSYINYTQTADEQLWELSIKKQKQVELFYDCLTDASIEHNKEYCEQPGLDLVQCGLDKIETHEWLKGEYFRVRSNSSDKKIKRKRRLSDRSRDSYEGRESPLRPSPSRMVPVHIPDISSGDRFLEEYGETAKEFLLRRKAEDPTFDPNAPPSPKGREQIVD